MIKSLHGVSTFYSNVMSDIQLAHQTGYQGVEFFIDKLVRYLDHGGTANEIKQRMDALALQTTCINALMGIDRYQANDVQALMAEALRITQVAAELECPTVQVNPGHYADALSAEQRIQVITDNLREIAAMGQGYGVRYQIEFVASTEFNTLPLALEVINRLNVSNVGLVMDFWHLHARGVSTPEDVAKLDSKLIYGVHFCDGRRPVKGEAWDELVLRDYMPGEGEIDVPAYVRAVKATGYDGAWSPELISPRYWEQEHGQVARLCLENMRHYLDGE